MSRILELTQHISYIDNIGLICLCEFIIDIGERLELSNSWPSELQRENDAFLTGKFSTLSLTPKVLRLVDNWRLYFQVNCLSDIFEASVNKIQQSYLKQYRTYNMISLSNSTCTKLIWQQQQLPSDDKGFKIWIKWLKQCFGLDVKECTITYKTE